MLGLLDLGLDGWPAGLGFGRTKLGLDETGLGLDETGLDWAELLLQVWSEDFNIKNAFKKLRTRVLLKPKPLV